MENQRKIVVRKNYFCLDGNLFYNKAMADNIYFNDTTSNKQFQRLIHQNKYKSNNKLTNKQKQYDDEQKQFDNNSKIEDDKIHKNDKNDDAFRINIYSQGTGFTLNKKVTKETKVADIKKMYKNESGVNAAVEDIKLYAKTRSLQSFRRLESVGIVDDKNVISVKFLAGAGNNKSVREHDYAIITVGAAGTGKSSIIQLFCGKTVQTKTKTKTVKLYEEIGLGVDSFSNRSRKWMDTPALNDVNLKTMKQHILNGLRLKNIHSMIVIWLISGDFTRQRGEYLRQAKFIKSLQNGKSMTNIWQNTLIIQKRGMLQPKIKTMAGIIDSAKKYGAETVFIDGDSICEHIVGFKCIDMMKENSDQDPMYQALIDAEMSAEKLMGFGYVTRKQMKDIIHEKLSKLRCFVLITM